MARKVVRTPSSGEYIDMMQFFAVAFLCIARRIRIVINKHDQLFSFFQIYLMFNVKMANTSLLLSLCCGGGGGGKTIGRDPGKPNY